MEYNLKPREVICIKCKLLAWSDDPKPECPNCKIPMITVVKSIETGKIITGTDHLPNVRND